MEEVKMGMGRMGMRFLEEEREWRIAKKSKGIEAQRAQPTPTSVTDALIEDEEQNGKQKK